MSETRQLAFVIELKLKNEHSHYLKEQTIAQKFRVSSLFVILEK